MATDVVTRESLATERADVKSRLQEIDAEFAGQALPDDIRDEWNAGNERVEAIDTLDEELRARHDRIAELVGKDHTTDAGHKVNVRTKATERDIYDTNEVRKLASSPDAETRMLRDNALRATEQAHFPQLGRGGAAGVNAEDCQAHIDYLMRNTQETVPGDVARRILHTGSPAYRRAWGKTLTGQMLTADEQRAMSLTGAGGGFAVPFALDPTLVPTSNYVVNPARALGNVVTIAGSNTWLGVTSPTVTATRVAEGTEATDNAPTLVQPSITVTKAHCFVPFSIEISEDWEAISGEMARMIQQGKDEEEGTAFVTGAGTTVNPQGFVTGTTATVAAASGLTVTAANVYALEAALPPRFRPNESFVSNRGIYNVVRGIDTAGGAALWLYISQGLVTQAPTPGNTGATLLGRGAWEASAMQATVVNATKIMVCGDFSYFKIVDRIGMNIELIPHIFGAVARMPIGQRGLYAYWRNSSRVLSASAFVALTGTT